MFCTQANTWNFVQYKQNFNFGVSSQLQQQRICVREQILVEENYWGIVEY